MENSPNGPKGIGGWLILPALGLVVAPIRLVVGFYNDLLPVFESETWNALTDVNSAAYHPLWKLVIAFEVVANLALLLFTLWLAWHFFHKSKRVPQLFIILMIANVVTQVVDLLLSNQIPAIATQSLDPEAMKNLMRSVLGAAIWIPYFLKSKRVKNTFIEPIS